jgi:hypothetical protein
MIVENNHNIIPVLLSEELVKAIHDNEPNGTTVGAIASILISLGASDDDILAIIMLDVIMYLAGVDTFYIDQPDASELLQAQDVLLEYIRKLSDEYISHHSY